MPTTKARTVLSKSLLRRLRTYQDERATTCQCGDALDEHGHDDEYPGSTACNVCHDCLAFEPGGKPRA